MNARPAFLLALLLTGGMLLSRGNRARVAASVSGLLSFLSVKEGRIPYCYRDSAGILTFGVGHVVQPGETYLLQYTRENPAPDSVVDSLLARDSAKAVLAVRDLEQRAGRVLTDNQRTALTSLVFNAGKAAIAAASTIGRAILAGNVAAAADGFLLWNKVHVDGVAQVDHGLAARRADERALFLTA